MFLENLLKNNIEGVTKLAKESCTYGFIYNYWRDVLFERVMRLFVWEDTGNVKPKEIEQRLLLAGHCGITKILNENEVTAMFGSFYGVSKYHDEWKRYTVRCPIYSGTRKIGKDIVVIDNNSLRNPSYMLVHHYATMLAHIEVTLIDLMVNARDSGGVPIASTQKQKTSIQKYQTDVFNGKYGGVTDIGALGINYVGTDRKTAQNIADVVQTREKILKSFYSDIGVRSAFEKRSNSVEAEVEADTSLLLLNLSDMIDKRKKGCEEVNKMFGTNWSVHIAEEIDYGIENQRVQFDTVSETHVAEGEVNENS